MARFETQQTTTGLRERAGRMERYIQLGRRAGATALVAAGVVALNRMASNLSTGLSHLNAHLPAGLEHTDSFAKTSLVAGLMAVAMLSQRRPTETTEEINGPPLEPDQQPDPEARQVETGDDPLAATEQPEVDAPQGYQHNYPDGYYGYA